MLLVPTDETVRSDATLDGILIPMKTPSGGSIGNLVTHEVLDEIGGVGLPLGTIPVSKLESGPAQPASVLAEAERRADRMLAARWLLEPAVDSRARSEAG